MDEDLQWTAPEFEYTPKGPDWYWANAIVAITLIIAAIMSGNVLFALVILFGTVALNIQASKKPDSINYAVGDRGVRVGNTLYPYTSLRSFWIQVTENEQKLLLQSEKVWMPYIIIPLTDVDPDQLRNYLLQHLPEQPHQEPLTNKVMEYLGF